MRTLRYYLPPIALIAVLTAFGCRRPSLTVAVIPRTCATMLWEPMHVGAALEARNVGLHLYWNAPAHESDSEAQRIFVLRAIFGNMRGIIYAPDETLGSRTVVREAVRRRIPVVVVDDRLGPPPGRYLSYVTNDEARGAELAATRLSALLHGKGSIAILGINRRQENGILREESFEKALAASAPGIRIATRRFGDLDVTHEQQIADEVLHAPEPVDAIVALSSSATRGAYYAKVETDPPAPVHIVGFDQDLLPPIRSGEIDAVVIQNTLEIGRAAMRNVASASRGEDVPGTTLIQPMLLTAENIESPPVLKLWSFASYPWSQQ